jgi:F-type H+-transporting ATPase subunit epsilon
MADQAFKVHSKQSWVFSETIRVEIVSAEKAIFSGDVRMIVATGSEGEIGILPGHIPLLTMIKPGQIRLTHPDGTEENFYVSGGFLEVQPSVVTILADTVIRAEDIDEQRALEAKAKAEEILAHKKFDHYTTALSELTKALAQISAIKRWRKIK